MDANLEELLRPAARKSAATFYDHSRDPWFKQYITQSDDKSAKIIKTNTVPLCNTQKRLKYRPSKPQDFGDGGAFPEIHYAQYPLEMGKKKDSASGSKTLPVTVDNNDNLTFDAIVKQNENASKIVYSQHRDLVPKIVKYEEKGNEMDDKKQKQIDEITQLTRSALGKIVNVRLGATQPKKVQSQSKESKFIKYKPSQQSSAFNSGAKERIIRMVEMPVDPLDPPKFKRKPVPKANSSPPVPVMHSPPRSVTIKDRQDWKIPPCISNWKNAKGYTIPLNKRVAADGRGVQEVQINDKFAELSEALYVAEQEGREAVSLRSKLHKEIMMKVKEQKEQELRALAQKARSERTGTTTLFVPSGEITDVPMREKKEEREERVGREKIREERRREKDGWKLKMPPWGKRVRLPEIKTVMLVKRWRLEWRLRVCEVMYDQRLFNQERGVDLGVTTDVYDRGLFTVHPTLSTLYRPKKDIDGEVYGGAEEQLQKIRKSERFKPSKGFSGACEKSCVGPEEADPFGLDQFLSDVKGGSNMTMFKVGSGGNEGSCRFEREH